MKRILQLSLICTLLVPTILSRAQTAPDAGDRFKIPPTDDGLPGAGPLHRADWFQKIWRERRSAWVGRAEQDRDSVVFLGDSITQGWGENFRGLFPGIKAVNRGIGGDTTRGVLYRLDEDVISLHPAAIVLMIGTNDIGEKAEPEVIVSNLKLILAKLKAHNPKMPIILCQVFPSSEKKGRPSDKIKALNQQYAAAVKGDAQITFIETWPLFAAANGDAIPEEFPDMLHLNDAAYKKWAAALRPVLATLGFIENEPDKFVPEDGFTSLFNGHDLTGWGYRTNSFDGQATSSDGRYVAKNARIIVTTPPEGRKVQQMWTTKEFPKDFVLKLEFRATPNADSGVFIRKPQLQCRDYPLAGPYKSLTQYKPQDWNELTAIVTNGVAYCTCNGEVLEAALKVPETGPIGLEGDRGQMEYRRIRLKELP